MTELAQNKPYILLILMGNFGWGKWGCYQAVANPPVRWVAAFRRPRAERGVWVATAW